jgi:DnaK suppressor protein
MKARTTKPKGKVSKKQKKASRPSTRKAVSSRPRRPKAPAEKAGRPKAPEAEPRENVSPVPAGRPGRPKAPVASTPSPVQQAAVVEARRKQFEHYRELLLRKQRELTQAYAVSRGDSRGSLDDGTEDYMDYAAHSYAREFLLSLTEFDRKQLLQVEDALRRIDRGEYGHCLQCGGEIHPKRLEVAPWARYCVKCQELEEKGLLPQPASPAEEEKAQAEDIEEEEVVPEEEEIFEEDLEEAEEEVEEPPILGEEVLPIPTEDDEEE